MCARVLPTGLARDWKLLERLRWDHWAAVRKAEGPEASLRASQVLYEHARRIRPEWPAEAERAEDLAHHIAMKRCLERVSRALAAR